MDAHVAPYPKLFTIAQKAVRGGADILQLRDKEGNAQDILRFIRRLKKWSGPKTLVIVNDRVDLAYLSPADGVHVGQQDVSVADARKILGRDKLIGLSCQNSRHLRLAEESRADYIGFGSVFKTKTKPGRSPMALSRLRRALRQTQRPLFAIGGIDRRNLAKVLACGVRRVALTRAILNSRSPEETARSLKTVLAEYEAV